MNTLEEAFLDSLAGRLVIEDTAEAKAAVNPRTGQPYPTGISLEPAMGAVAETVGAAAKGAAQGFVGLPGDLIALARGVYELGRSGGDLDAMLAGLESKTGLPTTEDVKKFLDEAGLKIGDGESPAETVGEFVAPGGYIKGAKAVAKPVAKAVKETLSTPPKGMIRLAPDLDVEIAPAERAKNFKNWFGKSKIVDDKGKPEVWYHGTPASFDEFGVSHRNAIFFTKDTKFANTYTGSDLGMKYGATPNVMPVYIKASNPFDYENPKHIEAVFGKLKDIFEKYPDYKRLLQQQIKDGNWEFIEEKEVIDAIKKAGFDAFYVMEDGVKNLGVFDPKQIKSAIGNKGTFNPNDPSVVRGAVAAPAGTAAMQDEEKK